jgi:hypothetical protein
MAATLAYSDPGLCTGLFVAITRKAQRDAVRLRWA